MSTYKTIDACELPPDEQRVSWQKLVKRSKNIVLAKLLKVEGKGTRYTFATKEIIKGNAKATFLLHGVPSADTEEPNYNHHSSQVFWNSGRVLNDTDCVIYPSFQEGAVYLLFLDKPYHQKSFERIDDLTKDVWLNTVKKAAANAKLEK